MQLLGLDDARRVEYSLDLGAEVAARHLFARWWPDAPGWASLGAGLTLGLAFALDPDRGVLPRVAPGLLWVTVLLASLLATSRSVALEVEHGARDGLLLSGLDLGAVFLGKAAAVALELLGLEVLLTAGVVVLFDVVALGLGLALMVWHWLQHRQISHATA